MAVFESLSEALKNPLAVKELHTSTTVSSKQLLKFENLEVLECKVSSSATLPPQLFTHLQDLPRLHTLRIEGLTERLPNDLFALKNLRHLQISGNAWEVPDRFAELPNLAALYLRDYSSNQRGKKSVFPASIFTLGKLRILQLRLETWASFSLDPLGNLTQLRELILEFPAWQLPDGLYALPRLERFHLISPPHFPSEFFRFTQLKSLLLEWKSLPDGFKKTDLSHFDQLPTSLEALELRNNMGQNELSTDLARGVFCHSQLQKLSLHRVAYLAAVPTSALRDWTQLRELYLSTRGFIDPILLGNLFTLRNLQSLTIRAEELFLLPQPISGQHFPCLENLTLDGCYLSRPSEVLQSLNRLQTLSLNYTWIDRSDSLAGLWEQLNPESLTEFRTGIADHIPAGIARFQGLHTLYLSNKTTIAPEVVLLKNLRKYPYDKPFWKFAAQLRSLSLSDAERVGCMALHTGDYAMAERLPDAALWEMRLLRSQYNSDDYIYPILNTTFKILLRRAGFKDWDKCWERGWGQDKYD